LAPRRALHRCPWLASLLAVALVLTACKRKPATDGSEALRSISAESPSPPAVKATGGKAAPARSTAPPPAKIWEEFSGERAFAEVKKQFELGPRPSGSTELDKARGLIAETLAQHGWDIERQEFTSQTPRGSMKFVNIIARFSATTERPAPATTQQAIVCSHYDTKRFSTIRFAGANDGASSTGALLELARVLALDPTLAAKVELVFFDGEEALVQFSEDDGLYGSREYARVLRESGRAAQFKFGILWDMIGDRELTITLPPDSPQPLTQQILAAAEATGVRSHFTYHSQPIWDDHVPLNRARIPTIDLIDFDYFSWHTADDTLDKLSPESLRKVGALTLYHLRAVLGK